MTNDARKRVTKGVPTGGQFAAENKHRTLLAPQNEGASRPLTATDGSVTAQLREEVEAQGLSIKQDGESIEVDEASETQRGYEWKGWGHKSEQMEWGEDCGLSETNFPSSALEVAKEEFKKNPKAEIWYCTAGEVDRCVKAVYFVDLGKINLSDDGSIEWVDAAFYEGSTPAEILDDATFDWLETIRRETDEAREAAEAIETGHYEVLGYESKEAFEASRRRD
jgi:hypothetical protein